MILICQNRVIHVQVMNWRSLNMFTRIKLTNSWVTWRSYSTLKIICLSTQYIVVRWFKFCLSASFYQHIYRFVAEPFLQEESVVVTTFVSEMGKMVGKTIQVRITFQTKYFEATFFICQKREILGVQTSSKHFRCLSDHFVYFLVNDRTSILLVRPNRCRTMT